MLSIQQEIIRQRQVDAFEDAARARFVARAVREARAGTRAGGRRLRPIRLWQDRKAARAQRALAARASTRLQDVPLFAGLSRRDLALLQRRADRVTLPAGTEVVCENHPQPQFMVILRGIAEATVGGHRLTVLTAGDHFGELTLLDGQPVVPTITALTDVEALVMGRREFWGSMHAVPTLSTRLAASVAEDLRRVRTRETVRAS